MGRWCAECRDYPDLWDGVPCPSCGRRTRIPGRSAPVVAIEGVELDALLWASATDALYAANRKTRNLACRVWVHDARRPVEPERFEEIARRFASVKHPQVLELLGCGTSGSLVYKVEEVARGDAVGARAGELVELATAAEVVRLVASVGAALPPGMLRFRPFALGRIYRTDAGLRAGLLDLAVAAAAGSPPEVLLVETAAALGYHLLSGREARPPLAPIARDDVPEPVARALLAALEPGRPPVALEAILAAFLAPVPRRAVEGPVCEVCRRVITPDRLPKSAHRKGRYVCPGCRGPRVVIPGLVLGEHAWTDAFSEAFHAQDASGEARLVVVASGGQDPESKKRFLADAAARAKLSGPGVAPLLAVGVEPAAHAVLDGAWRETLHERIGREGSLPVRAALAMTHELARGLATLEGAKVVLRDLGPRDILIASDGRAGLWLLAGCFQVFLDLNRNMFGASTWRELPFSPPEVIEDALCADPRSSIYSLGACLYYALAARKPFTAKSNMDFFMKILNEDPAPLAEVRQDVPPIVVNMIAKCMRKKREDRYQSAAELARVIGYLLEGESEQERIDRLYD